MTTTLQRRRLLLALPGGAPGIAAAQAEYPIPVTAIHCAVPFLPGWLTAATIKPD